MYLVGNNEEIVEPQMARNETNSPERNANISGYEEPDDDTGTYATISSIVCKMHW